jgi:hypothetical protein
MAKINVQGSEITVITTNEEDYICLTDMVKNTENGLALIEKWLRNKDTIEFIGIWEEMYNPSFNSPEFEGIKNEAGFNRFILSVKNWIEKTNYHIHTDAICQNQDFHKIYLINKIFEILLITKILKIKVQTENIPQCERLIKLNQVAIQQMSVLHEVENRKILK